MTPVTFEGCFGWLHPGCGDTGIVLCSAFGHENMNAYRGWGHLAGLLAGRGFHVLRFDYPGTGDSAGSETEPDRVAAWQGSIPAAARFLRHETGSERVVLIGLRLGATLALLASRQIEQVAGIACLAPVLSGRSYVRELRLLASAWREANLLPVEAEPGCDLEVVGERLTEATLSCLGGIDLRTLRLAARDVLIMQDGPAALTASVTESFEAQGCSVSHAPFPGVAGYLQDSFSSRIPDDAFATLLEWCERFVRHPGDARPALPRSDAVWPVAGASERAFRFGPADRLFGILCCPAAGTLPGAPTVIMLNTGFGRRIGDGRVFVTLARRLASIGIASLRMDRAGFGDSAAPDRSEPDPYSNDGKAEIIAAVGALERAGHANPFLLGNCSGAYSAFHGALAEPRVRGLILVNLQRFVWRPGASLAVENRRKRRPLAFYLRLATQASGWRRLAAGDVALGAIVAALCRRPLWRASGELWLLLEAVAGTETRYGQIMRWLSALNSREVAVSLLYSEGDPGLSELARHVPGHRLRRLPGIQVGVIPKADHALLDHTARFAFIGMVCRLIQEWLDAATKADALR